MAKVEYNKSKGVLHIGDGRFFHAGHPVEVDDKDKLLSKFKDLTSSSDDGNESDDKEESDEEKEEEEEPSDKHTESSLKKLNAEEQKDLIEELGGDVEETSNQEDRISLILQLQEDEQEEGE